MILLSQKAWRLNILVRIGRTTQASLVRFSGLIISMNSGLQVLPKTFLKIQAFSLMFYYLSVFYLQLTNGLTNGAVIIFTPTSSSNLALTNKYLRKKLPGSSQNIMLIVKTF